MNIKKISTMKLDLRITEERKNMLLNKLLDNSRLFFIMFTGAVLIYSFNMLFEKAYIELNYISYPDSASSSINFYQESSTLGRIMEDIEERKDNLKAGNGKKYKDPFNFGNSNAADAQQGGSDNAEDANTGSSSDKNSRYVSSPEEF